MTWRKGRISNLIHGNDTLVRGVELKVYQSDNYATTNIRRPLQRQIYEDRYNEFYHSKNKILMMKANLQIRS